MLSDSNVYGPVVGPWRLSISFHSPIRETLYSLPYPLRLAWHQGKHSFSCIASPQRPHPNNKPWKRDRELFAVLARARDSPFL